MSGLDIRAARPEDMAELTAMIGAYLAEIAPELDPPTQDRIANDWSGPDRFVFLLHEEGLTGFALVRHLPDGSHEMSEFCIRPDQRRAGLGRQFARAVFSRFPGRWRLGLASGNPGAGDFWTAALVSLTVRRGPPLTPAQTGSLHFTVKEPWP